MTFFDAVKTCYSKYADFSGCAVRSEFWWFVLFNFIVMAILGTISETLSAIYALASLLPNVAVTARRLHDTDRSGWMQLIFLLPIVGWIIVLVFCAQDSKPSRFCAPIVTEAT